MDTTSATLLERVRNRHDAAAWKEFNDLNQVYLAKSRMTRRLRKAMQGRLGEVI